MCLEVTAPETGEIAKIAILFDAENISCQLVEAAIAIAKPYGKPILRAYGDFSKPHIKGWEEPALKHGIRTIHQFSYSAKNSSSDFLMMHDAFKLAHSGKINTFVIVTNDSDFITPIQLLRQSGAFVHGVGVLNRCSEYLRNACNQFTYLECREDGSVKQRSKADNAQYRILQPLAPELRSIGKALLNAYELCDKDPQGWIYISYLRTQVDLTHSPYKKFSTLLKNLDIFELSERNQYARLRKDLY